MPDNDNGQHYCTGDEPVHTVEPGDWLSKIALRHGFQDGGEAIWKANPRVQQLSKNNRDLLLPGWELTIPKFEEKQEGVSGGQRYRFQVTFKKKSLRLTLRDATGAAVSGWQCRLLLDGELRGQGATDSQGAITFNDLPQNLSTASLEIQESHLFSLWKYPAEQIELEVGGLDPIAGEQSVAMGAVQKILANLGFYRHRIDGVFGPHTRAALTEFQNWKGIKPANGLADAATCSELSKAQQNEMETPGPVDSERTPSSYDPSMFGDPSAEAYTEKVTPFSEYHEPTDVLPTQPRRPANVDRRPLGQFHFFPHTAYVALSDPGKEKTNPNLIQMPARRFLFLDAGRWHRDARDFGVIWGRHVYLCKYHASPGAYQYGSGSHQGRLDYEFFRGMKGSVEVVKQASATWAPASDFDWDQLYLIVPDLHLMTPEDSAIWFGQKHWHQQPEKDLLDFARKVCELRILNNKARVVQLGDSYELWWNFPKRYFTENNCLSVELQDPDNPSRPVSEIVAELAAQVRRIRADNPADQALRLLEDTFNTTFLHGNHDNYLIQPLVTSQAEISTRVPYCDWPGVFIEHGHRLEYTFFERTHSPQPYNYDGAITGYKAATDTFNEKKTTAGRGTTGVIDRIKDAWSDLKVRGADVYAGLHDQSQYLGEASQLWLGRQSRGALPPPHVFVIGHTHMPNLWSVDIDAWRTPTAS